jgi:hypothetical protein
MAILLLEQVHSTRCIVREIRYGDFRKNGGLDYFRRRPRKSQRTRITRRRIAAAAEARRSMGPAPVVRVAAESRRAGEQESG